MKEVQAIHIVGLNAVLENKVLFMEDGDMNCDTKRMSFIKNKKQKTKKPQCESTHLKSI